jgi:hypothetical protein
VTAPDITVDDVLACAEALIWERSGGLEDAEIVERLHGRAKACQGVDDDAASVWVELAARFAHKVTA